ncbi:MAG: hypothetical protein A2202_09260 [Bdellovibrionales bacterium RIFOXYA1_FULL_36_14]|nr:MAG: hypothetical protein A2202_09260 [Bdellovibrionales bacterium RIFOXYA1_FULL_36_14]
MRKLSLMLFMLIFTCSSYGGFDAGGGPGISIEKLIDFLRNSQKLLIEGNFSENEFQKSLRLSSYQKNNLSNNAGGAGGDFWNKIIQNSEDNDFVILVIGKNLFPKNVSYVLVAFDAFDVVNGDLVFDLSSHAKTYQFDLKDKQFIEISFAQLYQDLCSTEVCPDMHFISIIK